MRVLVVGSGGREHAICWKLAQSPKVDQLYCAPGNGGIAQVADCVDIKATDVDGMVAWAKDNAMDFVVVAPDDPLALGMVDELEAEGALAEGSRTDLLENRVVLCASGIIMLMLGILGEYIWRALDAARSRPPYIIDELLENQAEEPHGQE